MTRQRQNSPWAGIVVDGCYVIAVVGVGAPHALSVDHAEGDGFKLGQCRGGR